MIVFYKVTPHSKKKYTQEELNKIEKNIIKSAIKNESYEGLMKRLQKDHITLQKSDLCHTKRTFIQKLANTTWSNLKKDIQDIQNDYHGIKPLKTGYQYKNKIYLKLEDAHNQKIRSEYPELLIDYT